MNQQIPPSDASCSAVQPTDAELLSLFAAQRDEAAFAELVHRHCGLVLGVCRRVLRNAHDVEDVFQATFLVLARDIERIRKHRSLTNWLYGVAYRLALLVVRRKVRRRETDLAEPPMIARDLLDDLAELHDQQLIDEELHALPDKYRQPLVLHYLAGKSQQDVADELGLTTGAVDGLLKRGRKELRGRLARRGIAIGAALAAVQTSQHVAQAADVNGLVDTTVQAGVAFTSDQPTAGAVSPFAAELAGKELAAMSMTMKSVLSAGIAIGAVTLGIGGVSLAIGFTNNRDDAGIAKAPKDVRPAVQQVEPVAQQVEVVPPPVVDIPPKPSDLAADVSQAEALQVAQNTKAETATGKYTNADEAYAIGAAFYNARNFAASQEPFEAALKLAPDDKYRVKVYRALMGAYRQLAEIDKFVEAADYIITKSESAPERSLTRTDLMSFVHQRGKTNDLAQRYEAVLKEDNDNVTALYVLSELYAELKRDPKRSAELLERLAKVTKAEGDALDVGASAKLAQQYVKQSKFKEGAELFEKIAPLDKNLAAWHWKEAAQAWIKAKDKPRALKAAKASAEAGPEKRGDLLLHFWHRALGQVFLETGEPALAIEHFEGAIQSTKIEGYLKDTKSELATAKEQAAKLGK